VTAVAAVTAVVVVVTAMTAMTAMTTVAPVTTVARRATVVATGGHACTVHTNVTVRKTVKTTR
jgi:hypothetical protein